MFLITLAPHVMLMSHTIIRGIPKPVYSQSSYKIKAEKVWRGRGIGVGMCTTILQSSLAHTPCRGTVTATCGQPGLWSPTALPSLPNNRVLPHPFHTPPLLPYPARRKSPRPTCCLTLYVQPSAPPMAVSGRGQLSSSTARTHKKPRPWPSMQ